MLKNVLVFDQTFLPLPLDYGCFKYLLKVSQFSFADCLKKCFPINHFHIFLMISCTSFQKAHLLTLGRFQKNLFTPICIVKDMGISYQHNCSLDKQKKPSGGSMPMPVLLICFASEPSKIPTCVFTSFFLQLAVTFFTLKYNFFEKCFLE